MADGLQGPSSAWLIVDGYDMTVPKVPGMSVVDEAEQEDTTGLGDSWREMTPVGTKVRTFTQEGVLFDTAALSSHAALVGSGPTTPQSSVRIVCLGFEGHTQGADFWGAEGDYTSKLDVIATAGELQKVNVEHSISGQGDTGQILKVLAAITADADTTSSSVDHTSVSRKTAISTSSVASPTVITCSAAHGLVTGDIVYIAGHSGSAPDINGDAPIATVTGANTFTVPINVTTGGVGGTVRAANSANGGYGYQIVTAFSGLSGYVGKVRDSTDDSSFADLTTFADVTSAPNAQRVSASGTVDRYLAADMNVTGTGSITVMIGFSRTPA